ncbi:MAG: NosD domain-containing protein [Candidatus Hodarchaeales archaeon]|jgi:parallel beta-helix repeat protein
MDNIVKNNRNGIRIYLDGGNRVENNVIQNNTVVGLYLQSSDSNIIEYNSILNNTGSSFSNDGAVKYSSSNNNQFNHNNFSFNYWGVYSSVSSNNTFYNNSFFYNYDSLFHSSSNSYHQIVNNTFAYNTYAIHSSSSFTSNNISNNIFRYHSQTVIFFQSSTSHSIFSNNLFEHNTQGGVRFASGSTNNTFYDNLFFNNSYGLNSNVGSSWVYNNTFIENSYAVRNLNGNYGLYQNNTLMNNGYGIYVSSGDNNTFIDNNIINNSNGIYFSSLSDNNTFYGNNFLHNVVQGFSSTATNYADNGTVGNFWLDHLGIDNDSDGILDTPYALDGLGGVDDNFPLSIWINETFSPEIINSPTNLTYETHSIGHNLTWRAIDESPYDYEVFFNGISQGTNTFISREFFNVSVDGFDLGETNVTVTFRDTDSNKQSKTIFVSVIDTIPPNLTSGKVIVFEELLPVKLFNWTLTDWHPWNYTIFKDGVLYTNGSWESGQTISVNVSSLTMGVYEFILYANDSSSNINSSTHYVVIYDGIVPVVSQPTNITHELGYPSTPIIWIANDLHPNNYTIFVNEQEYITGNWTSEVNISLDYSSFLPRSYNITLTIFDTSGWNATSNLSVTILPDSTLPLVISPGDQTIMETSNTVISWLVTDYNPTNYSLYKEGILIASDLWNSSFPIELVITNASIGFYNYTLVVSDISNATVTDTIFVVVEPVKGLAINSPENITYIEGMINNWITWTLVSNSSGNYTIFLDDVPIVSDDWTNSTLINQLADNLTPGTYNYSIFVRTTTNLTVNDTVFVFVLFDTTPPVISNESDIFILETSTGNNISWIVADLNPDTFIIYKNDSMIFNGSWVGNISLMIMIDGLTPGLWNYTIIIYDVRGLYAVDTVFVFVIDTTPPFILDAPQDQIVEDTTGLELSWQAIDYYPYNYSLILDNGTILTGYWQNNSRIIHTLSDMDIGNYTYVIILSDLFGLKTVTNVTIRVVDLTPPTIVPLADREYTEGISSFTLNWDFSDKYNGSYILYQDGVMVTSGIWSLNSTVSFGVDTPPVGIYSYTLVVTDYSGNQAIDNLVVTVKAIETTSTTTASSSTISSSTTSSINTTTTTTKESRISTGFEGISLLVLSIIFIIRRKKRV